MTRRVVLIIVVAFIASVAVRVPHLNRPLSAHHEYCTAFTLIALTNWHEDGFSTHHGVPSGGFVREAEKLFPLDRFTTNERAIGSYYFSHPTLAYDLPYLLFKLTGAAPNVLGLQLLNLLFHLITAFAFYHVVRSISPGEENSAALFAAVLYLFMPALLWFHGNAYMSDLFVQNMWVLHLVFAMRLFQRKGKPPWALIMLYGITLFLTVHTSWLGVFAAATAGGLAIWIWRSTSPRTLFLVLGVTSFAVLLALGLSAMRFLQVIDAQALFAHFGERFAVRGSFAIPDGPIPHLHQLVTNYRMGFLPLVLVLFVVLFMRIRRLGSLTIHSMSGLPLFVALSGIPVLLDHGLLLQYADHDFAALKAGPLLCGLAGIGIATLPKRTAATTLILTCLVGVLYFYRINPIGTEAQQRYALEKDLGLAIAREARPEEVVFAIDLPAEPQVAWYAHRNILRVGSVQQAEDLLQDRGLSEGVIFQKEGEGISILRIQPSK